MVYNILCKGNYVKDEICITRVKGHGSISFMISLFSLNSTPDNLDEHIIWYYQLHYSFPHTPSQAPDGATLGPST